MTGKRYLSLQLKRVTSPVRRPPRIIIPHGAAERTTPAEYREMDRRCDWKFVRILETMCYCYLFLFPLLHLHCSIPLRSEINQ
jgi:hypothetical protein